MRNMVRRLSLAAAAAVLAVAVPGTFPVGAGSPKPPENPATLDVGVDPPAVPPGAETRVTVRVTPADGIKINRYPKMKLTVAGRDGLVGPAEVAVGNEAPPPPDRLDSNYYEVVDPLELTLRVDPAAAGGEHRVPAEVRYFYCVVRSGFCAPKRASIEIPLRVAGR